MWGITTAGSPWQRWTGLWTKALVVWLLIGGKIGRPCPTEGWRPLLGAWWFVRDNDRPIYHPYGNSSDGSSSSWEDTSSEDSGSEGEWCFIFFLWQAPIGATDLQEVYHVSMQERIYFLSLQFQWLFQRQDSSPFFTQYILHELTEFTK